MRLCVFGATGPVGRAVVAQALDGGHEVRAVTRRPEAARLEGERLTILAGDVEDPASVRAAVAGSEAVVFTIGVNPTRKPVTSYSAGVRNVLAAMREEQVRRIVCVSSKELDEEGVGDEPWLYRFVFARVLGTVNKTIYDDMRRMESLLRASQSDWTIVRPAGLYAADQVTDYRCPAGHEPGVSTSVPDLAHALLRSATGTRSVGRTIQVLTDDGRPPYLLLLARQVSLHRT